jgi:hypothetical protein
MSPGGPHSFGSIPDPDNLLQLHSCGSSVIEVVGSAVSVVGQRERDKKSHSQAGSETGQ